MTRAWRIVTHGAGGPEVLGREEADLPPPGAGQVLVRHTAIGVNFIDTYVRAGLYPQPAGGGIGSEAAGTVEAVGPDVTAVRAGDRVAWLPRPPSAYASHSIVAADGLIALPDDISDDLAAAGLLKGLTAWMLAENIARAGTGRTILVHAAAGGVGSILVQWLKALDATVIAHAGTPEKAALARRLGADHALSCPMDDLAGEVRRLTDGRGVDVVLDGVGAASWQASLGATARLGLIVSYGNASAPVPPIRLLDLAAAGSLTVTRPTLFDHIAAPEMRTQGVSRLFDLLRSGKITIGIGRRFPLADAAEAHRALEGRHTTGSTLLIP